MDIINLILHNFLSFIIIVSVLVFVHEFGHYYIAKLCGVKIEAFSIGFGKKLFGWHDKSGTHWKVCLLPFGGYVKMFGDENAASTPDKSKLRKMTEEEKKQTMHFKSVYERIAIAAAGPMSNYLLAIIVFSFFIGINGISKTLPQVDKIIEGGAAYEAGFIEGDFVTHIGGKKIESFDELKNIVSINVNNPLTFKIIRDGSPVEIVVTPKLSNSKDIFGNDIKLGQIGIISETVDFKEVSWPRAIVQSVSDCYNISIKTLKALGEMIVGKRSARDLGGPLKIAKYSGQSFEGGIGMALWFMAMISVNLGLMNLLPIPVLDGGQIFFFVIEAIIGRPLPEKVQDYAFKVGLMIIISLMVFTTINDMLNLGGF